RQPRLDRSERVAAYRHDARLVALAGDADRGIAQVDAVEVEPGQLRQTQAGGIEELEYRLVAQRENRGMRKAHQASGLIRRQGVRQLARGPGGPYAKSRVGGIGVVARQVLEEAAPRGEHAGKGPSIEPPAMELGYEAPDVACLQPRERHVAGQVE